MEERQNITLFIYGGERLAHLNVVVGSSVNEITSHIINNKLIDLPNKFNYSIYDKKRFCFRSLDDIIKLEHNYAMVYINTTENENKDIIDLSKRIIFTYNVGFAETKEIIYTLYSDRSKSGTLTPEIRIPDVYINPNIKLVISVVENRISEVGKTYYLSKKRAIVKDDGNKVSTAFFNVYSYDLVRRSGLLSLFLKIARLRRHEQNLNEEIFYRCEKSALRYVDNLPHMDKTIRLACILMENTTLLWNTLVFSNYIEILEK